MIKEVVVLLLLLGASAVAWVANSRIAHPLLPNIVATLTILSTVYLIFKIVIEQMVMRGIKSDKTRYYIRKVMSLSWLFVFVLIVVTIWVQNPSALLVAYGLVGAGIAVSLQDLFKSIAGGLLIFAKRPYNVGDRIEINNKTGDVIDIGLLNTTLYELCEWVEGDQATGRITTIPNSYVLNSTLNNFTHDNSFIWDEVTIPITLDSDWNKASTIAKQVGNKISADAQKKAQREFRSMKGKYLLGKRLFDPASFITVEGNNYLLRLRYITLARERRLAKNNMTTQLINEFRKARIAIGSVTSIASQERYPPKSRKR